ncbi:hypothetical protein MTO96_013481 [Rhipicephalus appendiculatus]
MRLPVKQAIMAADCSARARGTARTPGLGLCTRSAAKRHARPKGGGNGLSSVLPLSPAEPPADFSRMRRHRGQCVNSCSRENERKVDSGFKIPAPSMYTERS